jgi:hypothetical protein
MLKMPLTEVHVSSSPTEDAKTICINEDARYPALFSGIVALLSKSPTLWKFGMFEDGLSGKFRIR